MEDSRGNSLSLTSVDSDKCLKFKWWPMLMRMKLETVFFCHNVCAAERSSECFRCESQTGNLDHYGTRDLNPGPLRRGWWLVWPESRGLRKSKNRARCKVKILVFVLCYYVAVFRALVIIFFVGTYVYNNLKTITLGIFYLKKLTDH